MPRRANQRWRGGDTHPPYCTCVNCQRRRLRGWRGEETRSNERQARRRARSQQSRTGPSVPQSAPPDSSKSGTSPPQQSQISPQRPDELERSPHPLECTCVECQRRRLQQWKSAKETRAAQRPSRTDSPKSSKSPRSRKSSKRSRPPEPVAGSPKSTKRSQSPEPSTSSSQASRHPPNRRQRPPAHKAGTRPPSSGYSRYRQPRRGSLFWHRTRWLAARLIIIATLVTAGVIGYHWYSGAPLGAAVEMMTEDYRLTAACPTESETVFDFLGRASYPDNDSRMSVRYPDGWEAQVCNGDLAYDWSPDTAEANQPTQTVAPVAAEVFTPDAQATAIPEIRPTAEVPVRRSVATPPSVVEAESVVVSGMRVDDVTIDAKGLVRTVNILVTNVLDEECTGLVFNVDLLNAEGELVGHMTIGGSGPVPAGKQKKFEQRYVGNTVSEAIVAAITCEGTVASSIAPTPMPAATNTPAPTPTRLPPATPGLQDALGATSSQKYAGGSPLNRGEIESWVIEFTNEERISVGPQPLRHDDAISEIARSHSENMARLDLLSHDIGGTDPTDRATAAGYNCRAHIGGGWYSYGLSENIAEHPRVTRWMGLGRSYSPVDYNRDAEDMARELVKGWMSSPGHRENILDRNSRRIGVGIAIQETPKYGHIDETVYATQNFSACR